MTRPLFDDRDVTLYRSDNLGARAQSVVPVYVGRDKGIAHPTPMALELAEWLVRLAARPGDLIVDPFAGAGTTAVAARRHGRRALLVETNTVHALEAAARLSQLSLLAEAPA